MKKAIPKEWVDIIKTENSQKSVVNICKNYVLIKGNPYQITIYPIIKQQGFVIKLDKFASPYNLFSDVCKI
jgi:hypothetical protein